MACEANIQGSDQQVRFLCSKYIRLYKIVNPTFIHSHTILVKKQKTALIKRQHNYPILLPRWDNFRTIKWLSLVSLINFPKTMAEQITKLIKT